MHLFIVITVFLLALMVGVEFSVSAFVNPSAWRLDPGPQSTMLSRFNAVLGKVMPVWYATGVVLLGIQTWLFRHTPVFRALLISSGVWLVTTLATIKFLVPLNNRVVEGASGWEATHHTWDRRHRFRIVALSVALLLLINAVVS